MCLFSMASGASAGEAPLARSGLMGWVLESARGPFTQMFGAWAVRTLTKTTNLSKWLRLSQCGGLVCRGGAPKGGPGE